MNCSDFQELISARLDKELTPEEEKVLAQHLETCANCATLAKKLEELQLICSNWKNAQIPVELEKQILNRTVRTPQEKRPASGLLGGYYKVPKSLAWASILLFLILMVNSFLNPLGKISHPPETGKSVKELSGVQRVVLTENDVVRTYTILENKN
jgi:anti-sigma factor RsiW